MLKQESIDGFETISLEEMEKVKLMNRIDTKYVAHISQIIELLRLAKSRFKIQQIEGECNMPYHTLYYDTPDVDMYYQHQRGKKARQKIRKRVYEGSDNPPFLEIKTKSNKGRTKKKRVGMEFGDNLDTYSEFLGTHADYSSEELVPRIENHFYRITLVNHEMTERVTIDTNLEFHNFTNHQRASLPLIGIIEWKRDGRAEQSPLKEILLKLRIKESGFSKYCIGMAMTDPALPHNKIKKRLRYIDKISNC